MSNMAEYTGATAVALLAEGVDRNIEGIEITLSQIVALLAEGVDRNNVGWDIAGLDQGRPPRGGRG